MCIHNYIFFLSHSLLQVLTRSIKEVKHGIITFIITHTSDSYYNILDFGCGEGLFSDILQDRTNFRYISVDKNYSALDFAKHFSKTNIYIASDENICFKEGLFKIFILNNVLHHMKKSEIIRIVKEARRVMTQDAYLIVIELVQREFQNGLFFKLVTYWEQKIKNIKYCDTEFLNVFLNDFQMVNSQLLCVNFKMFVFIPRNKQIFVS